MGVTKLKDLFKGDMEKEFKKIEKAKQKEMTESAVYKSFKIKEWFCWFLWWIIGLKKFTLYENF